MKQKHIRAHMRAALAYAECSVSPDVAVGCVIADDDAPISSGYNGLPPGWDGEPYEDNEGHTVETVLHAEENALDKLTRKNISSHGAHLFINISPCFRCARRIANSGIKSVYYLQKFWKPEGDKAIAHLEKCGVKVHKIMLD